jgi:hypothetical protein
MIAVAERPWFAYVNSSDRNDERAKIYPFKRRADEQASPSVVAAKEPALFASHDQIDQVEALPVGWDGRESPRADPDAVANARQFLEEFYALVTGNESVDSASVVPDWRNPHISAGDDGDISFEWWHGKRKLTIYISGDEANYITSRGPHIINDMEHGSLEQKGFAALWDWLFE